MRIVASLLVALQLLVAAHALWHHHDHESAVDQSTACAYCLVLHQPAFPAAPQLLAGLSECGTVACELATAVPHAAPHGPPSIRGPPHVLAI